MTLFTHMRNGLRLAVRRPGTFLLMIAVLGLGIGLTGATFSIVEGVVLKDVPIRRPERVMVVNRVGLEQRRAEDLTFEEFLTLREGQRSFSAVAALRLMGANVTVTGREPIRLRAAAVTWNLFPVLGVQPQIGRSFTNDDGVSGDAIIVSEAFWKNVIGEGVRPVGHTVRVNGELRTVVGVMPQKFAFPNAEQIWIPIRERAAAEHEQRIRVIGRLADETSEAEATAEFAALRTGVEVEHQSAIRLHVRRITRELVSEQLVNLLNTMLAAVFGVLLIACANVANVVLAMTVTRVREIATRYALGASRRQIVIQLISEVAGVAAVGAAVGLAVAYVGVRAFNLSIGPRLPYWMEVDLSVPVLAVVGLTGIATALFTGVFPALNVTRLELNDVMQQQGRSGTGPRVSRTARSLLVVELALSCALLIAAGLTIKSVTNLASKEFGFRTDDILTGRVDLLDPRYLREGGAAEFTNRLLEVLRRNANIVNATVTSALPGIPPRPIRVQVESAEPNNATATSGETVVDREFFSTFGIPITAGRGFQTNDTAARPLVAVVNQTFAKRYWDTESPVGKRIRVGRTDWHTIVGVVPDVNLPVRGGPGNSAQDDSVVYFPLAQHPVQTLNVAIRTRTDPSAAAAALRAAVATLDPNLPVADVKPMPQFLADAWATLRVFGSVFIVFGVAALLLACIGLYGVLAFLVSRRTREIGIRIALGAQRSDVVRWVARHSVAYLSLGICCGVLLGAALARMLSALLFEVSGTDASTFAVSVAVLATTAATAHIVPLRRALRVDPVMALRTE